MTLDDIRADFALLDDWEDKYRYVIELGRALPAFDEAERTPQNKVRGCVSQVWLATRWPTGPGGAPVLDLQGDSDAHIVRGLVAILLTLYAGRTADEVLGTDARAVFGELGLSDHLTAQRSNGLNSMVERIRADAQAAVATQSG
jgi:cysteine desulfuration protein SufE